MNNYFFFKEIYHKPIPSLCQVLHQLTMIYCKRSTADNCWHIFHPPIIYTLWDTYHKISNISCTTSQNVNDSHLTLQLSLPNPLRSTAKLKIVGAAPTGDAPTTVINNFIAYECAAYIGGLMIILNVMLSFSALDDIHSTTTQICSTLSNTATLNYWQLCIVAYKGISSKFHADSQLICPLSFTW